jgi:hypothetical protein
LINIFIVFVFLKFQNRWDDLLRIQNLKGYSGRNIFLDTRFPKSLGSIQMPNGDFQIPNGDFPMPNGDLQMSNGDIQMPNGDFPMPNGYLPLRIIVGVALNITSHSYLCRLE